MTHVLRGVAVALVAGYLTASTTWMFVHSSKLAAVEVHIQALAVRIQALESGRTTPMAAETRAELNAVWREIEKLRGKP